MDPALDILSLIPIATHKWADYDHHYLLQIRKQAYKGEMTLLEAHK